MEACKRKLNRETLVNLVKEIDDKLELVSYVSEGGYGIILKVRYNQGHDLKLKVNKTSEVEGMTDTLEREYAILEDLARKTDVVPKPVRLYDNAKCAWGGSKGKYAYLAEFIEGKALSKSEKQSEISLTIQLTGLMDSIHGAGYRFSKDADLNADNILLGEDGKLYLLDPMFLVPLKEKIPFGMTKEEREKVNEIIRRYSYSE